MNTTQRTPQQASIDAREARESWERGETIEGRLLESENGWVSYNKDSHPYFTSQVYEWRVKPTPTIAPGRWRMRNGEVVTVKAIKNPVAPFVWISDFGIYSWDSKGILYASKTESGYDLISKVETRWRPWKAEEVPSGGWVRLKDNRSKRAAIVVVEPNSIGVGQRKVSYQQLFEECELLNPDGTYSPCGVEEEVG